MKSNNKKILMLSIILILLIVSIFLLYNSNNYVKLDNVNVVDKVISKDQIFAMYKKVNGVYEVHSGSTIPSGFMLNTANSYCMDRLGQTANYNLSWDGTNSKVVLQTKDRVYCYLYFDELTWTDSAGVTVYVPTGLVPVTISATGVVTKANKENQWYSYPDKQWANAVKLNGTDTYAVGATIPESAIDAYFVYIPKYRYQLFNMGNYTSVGSTASPVNITIAVEFNEQNTIDDEGTSCATPLESGTSGNCDVGEWMTHPAFITLDAPGIWVAKFEASNTYSAPKFKPNVSPVVSTTLKNFFTNGLAFDTTNESHLMKNTEWGAVAYLSYSTYGRSVSAYRNNNSSKKTGCGSSGVDTAGASGCTNAYASLSSNAYTQSTTGNITGVFDMNGGINEYVAVYISGGGFGSSGLTASNITGNEKYWDIYASGTTATKYNNRILGDATGELGPFFNDTNGAASGWNSDGAVYIASGTFFLRGGYHSSGVEGGLMYFKTVNGASNSNRGFRIVLKG